MSTNAAGEPSAFRMKTSGSFKTVRGTIASPTRSLDHSTGYHVFRRKREFGATGE
jgi:hypothetical protein